MIDPLPAHGNLLLLLDYGEAPRAGTQKYMCFVLLFSPHAVSVSPAAAASSSSSTRQSEPRVYRGLTTIAPRHSSGADHGPCLYVHVDPATTACCSAGLVRKTPGRSASCLYSRRVPFAVVLLPLPRPHVESTSSAYVSCNPSPTHSLSARAKQVSVAAGWLHTCGGSHVYLMFSG